jgi:hypothetical protein
MGSSLEAAVENTLMTIEALGAPARQALPAPRPSILLVEPPPPALRAQKLFEDAKRAALEQARLLEDAIEQARTLAEAVAEGGELYDPGLREAARQLSEMLVWKSKNLQSLRERSLASLEGPAPRKATAPA